MERRLAKKLDCHTVHFKDEIKAWFETNNCQVTGDANTSDFLKFVYDFNGISLNKEDFQKRKRIKSVVPQFERCCAKRANGDQCTRRKKETETFCGTHSKGTPHGTIQNSQEPTQTVEKVNAWAQDFNGIVYYIDDNCNVYNPEDIYQNKTNPKIIAKYVKDDDGKYTIPTLFNGEI